jgi:hypothetical protein
MKKLTLITLAFVATSCISPSVVFDYRLDKIEKQEKKTITTEELRNAEYEDNYLKIIVSINEAGDSFIFSAENNTENSIQVIWNDGVIIYPNRSGHKVMHQGVRFMDRFSENVHSIIPRKSIIEDVIVPAENISFYTYPNVNNEEHWRLKQLIEEPYLGKKELKLIIEKYKDQTIELFLPFIIEEEIVEYHFIFKIENVRKKPIE